MNLVDVEVYRKEDNFFAYNPPVDANKGTLSSVLQMLKELGSYILVVPVMLFDKLVTKIRGDDSATTQKVAEIAEDGFEILDNDGIEVEDSNRESAIATLKSDEMLGDHTVLQYLKHLRVKYLDHFVSSNPKSYEDFVTKLPKTLKQTIYIPVVLKGTFGRNHIVLITINQDSTIEYYDPKGKQCYEGNKKLLNFPEKTIEDLMGDLVLKYGGRPNQNQVKQQKDHHSCGVFVLNYIQEKENDKTFKQIVESPINPSSVRQKLVATFERPRRSEENISIAKKLKDKNSILNFLTFEKTDLEEFKRLLREKNTGILHIPVALKNGQVILFTVDHDEKKIQRYCPTSVREEEIISPIGEIHITLDVLGPIREIVEYGYSEVSGESSVLGYLQDVS